MNPVSVNLIKPETISDNWEYIPWETMMMWNGVRSSIRQSHLHKSLRRSHLHSFCSDVDWRKRGHPSPYRAKGHEWIHGAMDAWMKAIPFVIEFMSNRSLPQESPKGGSSSREWSPLLNS